VEETLTQKRLKEVLDYNKETGIFVAKIMRSNRPLGKEVGYPNAHGYLRARIDKKAYYMHRLAWLYVYGKFPTKWIDHKNRNKKDNRIDNLRDISHSENHRNMPLQSNNTSGYAGINWNKKNKKWRARIKVNSREIHLGAFKNKEEAVNAKMHAEKLYGFHENHGR
jgi:hypothetical protein